MSRDSLVLLCLLSAAIGAFFGASTTIAIVRLTRKSQNSPSNGNPSVTENEEPLTAASIQDGPEVCRSEECRESAVRIRASMDSSVDPCDDFYQFACGGFMKAHPVNSSSLSIFDQRFNLDLAFDATKNKLTDILGDEITHSAPMERARSHLARCSIELEDQSSESCLKETIYMYKWILGSVTDDQQDDKLKKVQTMLDDVKAAFAQIVNLSTWMDEKSKENSIDKANGINAIAGNEPWIFIYDDQRVDAKHRRPINPLATNSFYSIGANKIAVLLAITNPPFFEMGHDALDFGAMGSVLGHDLARSYSVYHYDKDGMKSILWNEDTIAKFFQIRQCLVDQYTSEFQQFIVQRKDEIKDVDGWRTVNENIADNAGLRAAFRAYKQTAPKRQTLKGLEEFSPDQLFFLSYANALCSSESQEFTEATILSRKTGFSPFRFRVNLPLKNFRYFSRTWNCPRESKMSKRTCSVWRT